ncbi:MAG: hypothetical protein ACLPWS_17160 [Rhodomicrobium sp.]
MKAVAASLLALALLSPGAHAQTYYSILKVCKFDIEQYCKDIKKARIRELRECLANHHKDLFPNCQDHYKEAR